MEEIWLGPLSRRELASQVAALAGGPVPRRIVDDLYARAEGNPFFTEQMVAAALASGVSGELRAPGRLEELWPRGRGAAQGGHLPHSSCHRPDCRWAPGTRPAPARAGAHRHLVQLQPRAPRRLAAVAHPHRWPT